MNSAPQFEWSDRALHIYAPPAEMCIRWHPEPLAEERMPGKRWVPFWPEFRLIPSGLTGGDGAGAAPATTVPAAADSEPEIRKQSAFAALLAEIPAELVKLAAPFGSHQWPLLVLLQRQHRAMELAAANPVLAYCAANSDQLRNTSIAAAGTQAIWYCCRKQRVILKWLGFPDAEAVVRLMRRIAPGGASPSLLRCLRTVLHADPTVLPLLAHQPTINGSMLFLIARWQFRPLITPKFLKSIELESDANAACNALEMALHSLRLLSEFAPGRACPGFQSLSQVQRFNDRVGREYVNHIRRRAEQRAAAQQAYEKERQAWEGSGMAGRPPYPPPPVPGTQGIIPLCSPQELESEGRAQRNCVGKYDQLVADGGIYIYRVIAPARATLSIVRRADGSWRRCELKGPNNSEVGDDTVEAVDHWLRRYRLSVS